MTEIDVKDTVRTPKTAFPMYVHDKAAMENDLSRISRADLNNGYRTIRNTLRFLIGTSDNLDSNNATKHQKLPSLERYILAKYADVRFDILNPNLSTEDKFLNLVKFCKNDLANFYLPVCKDALFCDLEKSDKRRAAQSAIIYLFDAITEDLGSLLPNLSKEARSVFAQENPDCHLDGMKQQVALWVNKDLQQELGGIQTLYDDVSKIRDTVKVPGFVTKVTINSGMYPMPSKPVNSIAKAAFGQAASVEFSAIKKAFLVEPTKDVACDRCYINPAQPLKLSDTFCGCARCEKALIADGIDPKTVIVKPKQSSIFHHSV